MTKERETQPRDRLVWLRSLRASYAPSYAACEDREGVLEMRAYLSCALLLFALPFPSPLWLFRAMQEAHTRAERFKTT